MRVEHLDLKAQMDVVDGALGAISWSDSNVAAELPRLIMQKEDAEDKLAEQTRKAEQAAQWQQRMFAQHERHLRDVDEYFRSKARAHPKYVRVRSRFPRTAESAANQAN